MRRFTSSRGLPKLIKAHAQPGRFQVFETLGAVNVVQLSDCFQFDDHHAVHHKVGGVLAYNHAVISDGNPALLLDGKDSAFSYTFSTKPGPSVFATVNAHPMIRSEIRVNPPLSVFICVHLWFQTVPAIQPSISCQIPTADAPYCSARIAGVAPAGFLRYTLWGIT